MRKEIPILFSTPVAKANIKGIKTQTRRAINPRTPEGIALMVNLNAGIDVEKCKEALLRSCRYGKPGDWLYGRETFQYCDVIVTWDDEDPSKAQILYKSLNEMRPDGVSIYDFVCTKWIQVSHEKGEDISSLIDEMEVIGDKWKPGIHMLKDAALQWMEVEDIRIERIQDISSADALKEGVQDVSFYPDEGFPLCSGYMFGIDDGETLLSTTPQEAFAKLWCDINGVESWVNNDYVFVISYKLLSTTGKPIEL